MKTLLQHLLPHHTLSRWAGKLANAEHTRLKSYLISYFLRKYPMINLAEAVETDINNYKSFNDFFIRRLKKEARPITQDTNVIVNPADGTIAEIGQITKGRLIQAKGHDFSLNDLLGNDAKLTETFNHGSFATIYLAPHNYHRVHVPYDSTLTATHFIPGRLFSVNTESAQGISSLYSRNERLVCIMENKRIGKFAIIFVGAMIVGSIQLAFENDPVRHDHPLNTILTKPISFKKGDELGFFKLGSTVIVLFEKDKVSWNQALQTGSVVTLGTPLATLSSSDKHLT